MPSRLRPTQPELATRPLQHQRWSDKGDSRLVRCRESTTALPSPKKALAHHTTLVFATDGGPLHMSQHTTTRDIELNTAEVAFKHTARQHSGTTSSKS